ncbi:DNA mismatch repair protein msh-2 [Cladophialophora bantiana CBS 173.52]|uniref:DNA mismatch repair protein MSH3 n=1 Tax=Cladophialophora bantiana (strain ATCC 10958 / CBS 173.52 / CDC B-1940 / NIH 8579) TaxID=1442370 RepID=A0A0D2FS36_CLAB1|nr:DNA mismatch repair protein msh-2 [Cladophialophora bantiana CBS 173.52]KIW89382.1 DNA mismatch repair protein msh-2 [Cladophialophora bantiana CBS 173.52]
MASRPELKVDDETGFIRSFRSLPPKPGGSNTIRVIDRVDWYSAHGEDAEFIARTVYKTTAVIRNLGRSENALPSVTMSTTVFRNLLREALFKLGKRVEIWEASGKGPWKLIRQASPGNLQAVEEELGSGMDSQGDSAPIILAVKVNAKAGEARSVGVCFADASVRELGVSEFLDNDLYSNLESLLIQLGVKECIVAGSLQKKDPELAKIQQIADSCGIAISERSAADWGTKDIEQDLARLLKGENAMGLLPQTDLKLAMGSAAALIKYLGVMTDPSNFGQYRLYQHDLGQYMKLDAAALRALNLMPGPRDGAKSMSLYGLLNHCKTPIGGRLLAQWLKQPLMNLSEIEKRQQLVEAFVTDTELRQTMQEEHLRSIPDLYRLAKKFQRKAANLEDVVRAYQVVIRLPGFIEALETVVDEQYQIPLEVQYTSKLKELSSFLGKLAEMVETTVDLDALDRHEFIIKPEFDEGLKLIRANLDKIQRSMDVEHRRVGKDLGQELDKKLFLENHRVHGHCFRLTRNEAGCIRNKKNYKEISTQKNGVYFTTNALAELRREHDQLSGSYNRKQSSLVSEVVQVASSYTPVIEQLAAIIAHLDVVVSLAHASVHAPTAYVRPKMHGRGTGDTILKEARHPCMEAQDDINFITNDVELRRDSSRFLIITGPNMGGKSTYIRTIGCIALMAQIGCFVPCTEAELTVFDCILARVGASDSQLKGVSTFMAEMLETANILKSATRDSLIIIDELGRGTSTYDGFGLAWAISEEIVGQIGAFGCFATHFHELTALADKFPNAVKNLHVVAFVGDQEQDTAMTNDERDARASNKRREVTLLYRVEPGISDQSFGIHVAELVRFPEKVISMARRKAEELEDFTSATGDPRESEYSKEDAEEASRLLKAMLKNWKEQTEGRDMSKDEKLRLMREMVKGDEKLMRNPFFQSVQTL